MTTQYEPRIRIWLDGVEVEAASRFILELEVEERADAASSFRMILDMSPIGTPDGVGDWDLLERGPFLEGHQGPLVKLMTRVTVEFVIAGPGGEPIQQATVFDGYVTCMEPYFGENRVSDSRLEVSGLDASALMHFQTVTKTWHDKTDAEIAKEIFQKYGFTATDESVDGTAPSRAIERGAMVQRCTDAEFLRMLARRNGFEVYVEAGQGEVQAEPHPRATITGHFHRPRPDTSPVQPELALFPRETPSLITFAARWDSHQPTRMRGWRLDELSRLIERTDIAEPGWPRLGDISRADAIRSRLELVSFGAERDAEIEPSPDSDTQAPDRLEAVEIHTGLTPHHASELGAMSTSAFRDADWFVTGEGVVRGERYPAVVRARRPIALRGAGRLLDGVWYCRAACHRWARDPDVEPGEESEQVTRRYEVDITLARNGLGSGADPAAGAQGAAS